MFLNAPSPWQLVSLDDHQMLGYRVALAAPFFFQLFSQVLNVSHPKLKVPAGDSRKIDSLLSAFVFLLPKGWLFLGVILKFLFLFRAGSESSYSNTRGLAHGIPAWFHFPMELAWIATLLLHSGSCLALGTLKLPLLESEMLTYCEMHRLVLGGLATVKVQIKETLHFPVW